jgi:hypothetical protein
MIRMLEDHLKLLQDVEKALELAQTCGRRALDAHAGVSWRE